MSTRASSSKAFIRVDKPNAAPVYHLPVYTNETTGHFPPLLLEITGALPHGRRLTKPLLVSIKYSDEEVIVSEPRFHIHASGFNIADALSAFRRIFSTYLDVLSSEEKNLAPHMLDQLLYLRSYISLV